MAANGGGRQVRNVWSKKSSHTAGNFGPRSGSEKDKRGRYGVMGR